MSDQKDELLLKFIERHRGALRAYLTWQVVAAEGWRGHIPQPSLESAQQQSQLRLEELFREYEKLLALGAPTTEAARSLLETLDRANL